MSDDPIASRTVGDYPEHDKLLEVSNQSQAIYDFLTWLEDERNTCLIEGDVGSDHYVWADSQTVKNWLAEFFEIDLDKIETEKRAMLDALRATDD